MVIERVELHHLHAGVGGPDDIGVHGVAHVQHGGRVETEGGLGVQLDQRPLGEEPGVGLAQRSTVVDRGGGRSFGPPRHRGPVDADGAGDGAEIPAAMVGVELGDALTQLPSQLQFGCRGHCCSLRNKLGLSLQQHLRLAVSFAATRGAGPRSGSEP